MADRRHDIIEAVDDRPGQMLPVIQAGPAQVAVVEMETQRSHQPEHRTGGNAGPTDGTRVQRDLGLNQDHIQPRRGRSARIPVGPNSAVERSVNDMTAGVARRRFRSVGRDLRGTGIPRVSVGLGVVRFLARIPRRPWPGNRLVADPLDDVVEHRRQEDAEERDAEHAAEDRRAQRLPHLGAGAAETISGTTPRMKANEVIMIGRNRSWQASRVAASLVEPASRWALANSTIKDRVLARQAHQHDEADLGEDVDVHPGEITPAIEQSRHIGTTRITARGSDQLSYCAARTRNTRITASVNANMAVLPVCSCKSASSVHCERIACGSSCWTSFSIDSIAWPELMPGAGLRLIVADGYRLYRMIIAAR